LIGSILLALRDEHQASSVSLGKEKQSSACAVINIFVFQDIPQRLIRLFRDFAAAQNIFSVKLCPASQRLKLSVSCRPSAKDARRPYRDNSRATGVREINRAARRQGLLSTFRNVIDLR
jgi:hypothetical protein